MSANKSAAAPAQKGMVEDIVISPAKSAMPDALKKKLAEDQEKEKPLTPAEVAKKQQEAERRRAAMLEEKKNKAKMSEGNAKPKA